ncbi:shikimate kinase [Lentisphaera profundi]|uniref:Shikimate kinase n=1 Tax=Lentisphaera profundi TaxID=1658616 RepID=A0ABY7VS87_9BACT|nr:shikimate kinase [Lentisphaera profundi]WDE97071.1 shikimate kinase [Lentisphaera profundi]
MNISQDKFPRKSNIVMVGMPGAGKSTIGVLLAKETSFDFLDVDVYIQGQEHRRLQEIIDLEGIEVFKGLEEKYLCQIDSDGVIVSTGGSAIYSSKGIQSLSQKGLIIFLKINMQTLEDRLGDFSTRGVVIAPGQTFEELFAERNSLYSAAADLVIECDGKTQDQLVDDIVAKVFIGK